jgi:hypothetical protein
MKLLLLLGFCMCALTANTVFADVLLTLPDDAFHSLMDGWDPWQR